MAGVMNSPREQSAPWWLLMQLWGLDAPVAAFGWGLAYTKLLHIPMIMPEPLLLLALVVWFVTLAMRLYRAVGLRRGWYVQYYQRHLRFLTLLILAVAAVTLWMLLFAVGQILITYAFFPLLLILLGYMPILSRSKAYKGGCHAYSLAVACSVPAAVFCMNVSFPDLFTFTPTWHLAFLLFLYYIARSSWMQAEHTARRHDTFVNLGLFVLFASCMLNVFTSPIFECPFYITTALGTVLLAVLVRLRPHLYQEQLFAISWLAMALPPLLGILLL